MSDAAAPVDNADDDLAADDLPFVADVRVQGPVRVQDVAVDLPTARNINLTGTVEMILSADPRRARVVLISASADFYWGVDRGLVDTGNSAAWPTGLPLEIRGRRAIYAKSAGASTLLSFHVEQLG